LDPAKVINAGKILTIYQFYQPPLYWQQFEDLAVQLLAEVHDIPNAQAFGRPGQGKRQGDPIWRC
jgi:aminoglycoside phosphotransferase (APT) family kinase protein